MKRNFTLLVLTIVAVFILGNSASAEFNSAAYLAANSDLPQTWEKVDCMNHYKVFGFWENRAIAFDLDEYLAANPDLPQDWSYRQALRHYNVFGRKENRLLAFDAQEYLSLYPDLPQDWSYDQAWAHYTYFGKREGRIASFDEEAYLEMYPDLPCYWGQAEAFFHYLCYGRYEGRVYDPYDEDFFLGSDEKVVTIRVDDFQAWWLEDIQNALAQFFIENWVPGVFGVVPEGIEYDAEFARAILEWNNSGIIEISQHGLDHQRPSLAELTAAEQEVKITNGFELLTSIGIWPNSFIAPFGEMNQTTARILEGLGLSVVFNPLELDLETDLLVLSSEVFLCNPDLNGETCGRYASFKDPKTILAEIEAAGNEVVILSLHMQDFESASEDEVLDTEKLEQFHEVVEMLWDEGYTITTAECYN
jgi:hypothetical protein